ncbi:MAG TPA: hypothetical protein VIA18_14215 [Polyangia bacterium]|nr:hypothetical protein [Polyangia bacterium]
MTTALLLSLAAPAAAKGKAEAKDAFRRALQNYNLSDFKAALVLFKEAYLDYPDPSFLFNIGQCQRQLDDKQEALLSYKAYLREARNPPNRAEVTALVHNLEQSLRDDEAARHGKPDGAMEPAEGAAQTTTPAPTPQVAPSNPAPAASLTATAPPPRKPVYKQWWLWTAVGVVVVAGVGLGVGLGLGGSTHYPSSSPTDGTIRF